jgi:hypothetical protein
MSESAEEELGIESLRQEQDLRIEELWQAVTSLQLLVLGLLDRLDRLEAEPEP